MDNNKTTQIKSIKQTKKTGTVELELKNVIDGYNTLLLMKELRVQSTLVRKVKNAIVLSHKADGKEKVRRVICQYDYSSTDKFGIVINGVPVHNLHFQSILSLTLFLYCMIFIVSSADRFSEDVFNVEIVKQALRKKGKIGKAIKKQRLMVRM